MTDSGRWDRLAADLTAAGTPAEVDEQPYFESVRGRGHSGIARSITVQVPGKGSVTITDKWWAKNTEIWLGWTVYAEGLDSIIVGRPSWGSKKRGETVTAVKAALARLGA
jgi:hypothetical protein